MGYLQLRKRSDILREVDQFALMDPLEIPQESRYLVEIGVFTFQDKSLED